jgi:hypothetical protein
MLNARQEHRTLDEASTPAVSPARVLITEREGALGAAIALRALCMHPFNISYGGRDNGWSPR